jgi:Sulfotransferase family
MSDRPICVLILSTKSAGSSALQELLCRHAGAKHVDSTHHGQNETLYWTKAASILGRKQVKIPESEVPIPPRKAFEDIKRLLAANVPEFALPSDMNELIFQGWGQLCHRFGPIFIEKSPHHLHQWAALDLLLEAARRLPDVDFYFVGLIRNPMDVLYSMWRRWRTDPTAYQHHWRLAYENLRRFEREIGDRLLVLRYEDLAAHGDATRRLIEFLGGRPTPDAERFMHGQSLQLWRKDRWFGFQLDPQVERLAHSFGYSRHDLLNPPYPLWGLYQMLSHVHPRSLAARWRRLRRQIRNYLQSFGK